MNMIDTEASFNSFKPLFKGPVCKVDCLMPWFCSWCRPPTQTVRI